MDSDRRKQIEELFQLAADLPLEDRRAWLAERCGTEPGLEVDVLRLLHAHELDREDALDTSVITRERQSTPSARIDSHIGPYRLRQVIGEGGMGTVYLAQQENPQRAVALKIMKHGVTSPAAFRRFEYETQLLGRLCHPGIAQIYEAGTHDDGEGLVPYFAMEYVPHALSLTDYARTKQLDTQDRLVLFGKVCAAVAHGHQKGVIHRDLKPSNILVDSSGRPKIIDFGVARATDSDLAVTTIQAEVGLLIGTLQYMSPEQCDQNSLDIDTTCDVYALGVVLYELLCDELPYDLTQVVLPVAVRIIQEQEPSPLSTVNRVLRGDIETIVLKALAKDPPRRYRTAAELGDEIDRYLNDEPILARPPGVLDSIRRLTRKHRVMATAASTALTVLVAAIVVISALWLQSREANRRAALTARDMWIAESSGEPTSWSDEAADLAGEAATMALSGTAALDAGRFGDAAEQLMRALAMRREAVSRQRSAVGTLTEAGRAAIEARDVGTLVDILDSLQSLSGEDPIVMQLETDLALLELSAGMTRIPTGVFQMGGGRYLQKEGTWAETGEALPIHEVRIQNDFLVSSTEITRAQFAGIAGYQPSSFDEHPDQPVDNITWFEAIDFCNRLSQREGLMPCYQLLHERRSEDSGKLVSATVQRVPGSGYRLLTEAEWEYACRAGTDTTFSFSVDTVDSEILDEYMWCNGNSGGATNRVAQKECNPWGLYDMHGNVWEWVEDAYHSNYEAAPSDGSPWIGTENLPFAVIRGGGWSTPSYLARSAARLAHLRSSRTPFIGFRIAQGLDGLDSRSDWTPQVLFRSLNLGVSLPLEVVSILEDTDLLSSLSADMVVSVFRHEVTKMEALSLLQLVSSARRQAASTGDEELEQKLGRAYELLMTSVKQRPGDHD